MQRDFSLRHNAPIASFSYFLLAVLMKLTYQTRERNWSKENVADMTTFPSPLVLPGDDIALDADYPHQSFDSWLREEDRNETASRKNVVHVAAPPDIQPDVSFIYQWDTSQIKRDTSVPTLKVEDVLNSLETFYLGSPVKLQPNPIPVSFTSWESGGTRRGPKTKTKQEEPEYTRFNIEIECVRIRTRAAPDEIFQRQLKPRRPSRCCNQHSAQKCERTNIDKQNFYESADDTFVCGRAYGGSRVAVVSASRYNPILDGKHNVDCEQS
ncbi:hypothetical protein RJZ57_001779 [Blastomyces gilchristii]